MTSHVGQGPWKSRRSWNKILTPPPQLELSLFQILPSSYSSHNHTLFFIKHQVHWLLLDTMSKIPFINTAFLDSLGYVSSSILFIPGVLVRFYSVFIVTGGPNWPHFSSFWAIPWMQRSSFTFILFNSSGLQEFWRLNKVGKGKGIGGSTYYGLGKNFVSFKQDDTGTAYTKRKEECWGQNLTGRVKNLRDRQKNIFSRRKLRRNGRNQQGKARRGAVTGGEFHETTYCWQIPSSAMRKIKLAKCALNFIIMKLVTLEREKFQNRGLTWWVSNFLYLMKKATSPEPVSNFLLCEMWARVRPPRVIWANVKNIVLQ